MRQVWVACGFGQGQRQLSFLESGGKKRHSLPCREETQTRWPLADTYPMNKQTKKESKSVRETQGAARGAERGTSSVTPPWRSPLLCQLPRAATTTSDGATDTTEMHRLAVWRRESAMAEP